MKRRCQNPVCEEKELEATIHAGMGQGSYTQTSESTPAGSTAEGSLAHTVSKSVTMSLEAVDLGVMCPGKAVGRGPTGIPLRPPLPPRMLGADEQPVA